MKNNSENIEKESFVIAIKPIEGIMIHSVGLVLEVIENHVTIFFIGKKKILTTSRENIAFLDLSKTDKPYEVKVCNICHILKNNDEFDINQTDAKGRKTTRPSCKVCRVDIDGVGLRRDESKKLDKKKPHLLFTCPICEKMSIADVTAKLVKDHDHDTGMARDWICDSCNTGLGRFKDDIKLLQKAIAYLEKHKNKT